MSDKFTQQELKKHFTYDPETGVFIRIYKYGRKINVVCDTRTAAGYVLIGFVGKRLYAHRLAFLYMTGKMPDAEVDHINGISADNRYCNLRLATRRQNCANQPARVTSQSGLKGVMFSIDCPGKPWRAEIYLNGRNVFLGNFPTREAASMAYARAALHEHGEFARYG